MLTVLTTKRLIALIAAAVLFPATLFQVGRFGAGPVAAGPWQEDLIQGEGARKIAVVNVQGEIVSGSEGFLGSAEATSGNLISQLEQARNDDAVSAVVLRLNTPGGSVVASDEIAREIAKVRRSGKAVVASMDEVAASGGYFLAAGANSIVANPSTITGSIGVIMVLLNLEGAAGKLGVEPIVVKAGRLKDIGSPFRDMTPGERRIFQRLLDEAHVRFMSVVSRGRQMPMRRVRGIADGRILSGEQAREAGLVDRLGTFDDAVAEARRLERLSEASVVEYERPFSFSDFFTSVTRIRNPRQEVERSFGVTGPRLAYLYIP
ncbi:MAG TPA: signal peptide peptidase SppA [Actinomycetota bacterium]|nr:signal peptide peptidase SppA [Actinomycetota bacterium]